MCVCQHVRSILYGTCLMSVHCTDPSMPELEAVSVASDDSESEEGKRCMNTCLC